MRSSCECGEGLDWLDDRMEEEVEEEEEVVGKPCSSENHQLPVREPEQDDKWE